MLEPSCNLQSSKLNPLSSQQTTMSTPLRSKQGCWTCRLRKKKCDEHRPSCVTCDSLSIICYGYGSKPDWMDNGEQEKAVSNSIKQIVKHTSRRKGRVNLASREEDGNPKPESRFPKLAPKIAAAGASPESSAESHHTNTSDGTSPQESNTSVESGDKSFSSETPVSMSSVEGIHLMHFMDTVFPLQYPMYKPRLNDGGRGWLLTLLLKTKPLYHAALGLSAYHRGKLHLNEIPSRDSPCFRDQEKHLAICLEEFQKQIKKVGKFVATECTNKGMGIMACIVQLVFFELFAGTGDSWTIHLRASINMIEHGYAEPFALMFFLGDQPTDADSESLEKREHPPTQEIVTCRFLTGVVLWLDIIASITAGTTPHLIPTNTASQFTWNIIKLEEVMGCQNWVMAPLGQVAALHEQKMLRLQDGTLNEILFLRKRDAIKEELRKGMFNFQREINNPSYPHTPESGNIAIVTMLFGLTTAIYLHLVTDGFASNEFLDNKISEAMMTFHTKGCRQIISALVFPLYIVGCVARGELEKEFFRKSFGTEPVLNIALEHRERILPMLEETWRRREMEAVWTWDDNLRLWNRSILLV